MTLEEKAKEWRSNYKPMGITRIERGWVVVETQSKTTRQIENPNPFRITDGWYELYLRDLDNAFLAGAKENGIQWHDLRKDPNDLPEARWDNDVIAVYDSGMGTRFRWCRARREKCVGGVYWLDDYSHVIRNVVKWAKIEIPLFKE